MTKKSIGYCGKSQQGIDEKVKENNTSINNKNKKKGDFKKVVNFYEENITLITPFVAESIEKYLEEDNLEANLLIETMKEAVARNKRSWKYISKILNNCIDNNIKTAKQFNKSQEEFKLNKQQKTISKTEEKKEYKEVTFENEEEYKEKLYKEKREE